MRRRSRYLWTVLTLFAVLALSINNFIPGIGGNSFGIGEGSFLAGVGDGGTSIGAGEIGSRLQESNFLPGIGEVGFIHGREGNSSIDVVIPISRQYFC